MRIIGSLVALIVIGMSATVAGQQAQPPTGVDLSLSYGTYGVFHGIYADHAAANPAVTIRFDERQRLDVAASVMLGEDVLGRQTRWGYTVAFLYRYVLASPGRSRFTVGAGATMLYLRTDYPATDLYPASRRGEFSSPLPTAAAGLEFAVNRHMGVRADLQILFGAEPGAAGRVSAGVVVPLKP